MKYLKNTFYLIVLLTVLTINANEINPIEKFNIQNFNQNKTGSSYTKILADRTTIRQRVIEQEGFTFYEEEMLPFNSPYRYKKIFYYNGQLARNGTRFYNNLIGIVKEYDLNGNLVGQIDYDAPFQFSFKDLAEKMKKEYNIDIYDLKEGFTVRRYNDKTMDIKTPYYQINFMFNTETGNVREILIDGKNGKELLITDFLSL